MDWLIQVVIFGFAALGCFVYSVMLAVRKKYSAGVALGALELLCAVISSAGWADALKVSGKADWLMLGFWGYRPIALIFFSMLLAGVVCIGANLGGIMVHRGKRGPAAFN